MDLDGRLLLFERSCGEGLTVVLVSEHPHTEILSTIFRVTRRRRRS